MSRDDFMCRLCWCCSEDQGSREDEDVDGQVTESHLGTSTPALISYLFECSNSERQFSGEVIIYSSKH